MTTAEALTSINEPGYREPEPLPPAPSCPVCGAIFFADGQGGTYCEWCDGTTVSKVDRDTFRAVGVVAYQPRSS